MFAHELYPKRLVRVRFSGGADLEVVRVEKMKIKKCTVLREDGSRWDFYPPAIHPAPDDAVFNLRVEEAVAGLGSVFKFKGTKNPGVYVVIAVQPGGTFKAVLLFNEGGTRYFHNVAPTTIEVLDRAALAAYLSYTS